MKALIYIASSVGVIVVVALVSMAPDIKRYLHMRSM